MLLYFFTCISFIFFLKSLPLKLLPQGVSEMRFVSLLFCRESSPISSIYKLIKNHLWFGFVCHSRMSVKKNTLVSKVESNVEKREEITVLDLPELVLECILERLPPASLCNMAGVCNSLRERCVSGHLWEKHMKEKWGRIIGPAVYREWQQHIATKTDLGTLKQRKQKSLLRFLSLAWPFSWIRSKVNTDCPIEQSNLLPVNSIMARYIALETGKFSFPAQVYNRENGHIGFMLSCYDAELSYDPRTDTFQARYPPHGRRAVAMENGIPWERLRAAPVDTSPHDLHVSDCLSELRPGDHIEIQWRKNKEFPYGWWYGVVGHLDSCDGTEIHCRCHSNESVALEFNHYTPGSRWRLTTIHRKEHREVGNEADGFYGGIRKLDNETEISTWKRVVLIVHYDR